MTCGEELKDYVPKMKPFVQPPGSALTPSPAGVTGLAGYPRDAAPKVFPSGAGNTNDADPVDFVSPAVHKSSTSWQFNIRAIASPGQHVWLMEDNKVVSKKVGCVRIHIVQPKLAVRMGFDHAVQYSVDSKDGSPPEWLNENEVFATKADLLASL